MYKVKDTEPSQHPKSKVNYQMLLQRANIKVKVMGYPINILMHGVSAKDHLHQWERATSH